jgi:hypothetical protein
MHSLPDHILGLILRQVDLPTLAAAEATCSSLYRVAAAITLDPVICNPPRPCKSLDPLSREYVGFIRWLRRHAPQFRSVVITVDEPDLANAIGGALVEARSMTALSVVSTPIAFFSNWSVPAALACAAPSGALPQVETMCLGRCVHSATFLTEFQASLRTLSIVALSPDQTAEILGLELPNLEHLKLTSPAPLDVAVKDPVPGFSKLKHLTLRHLTVARGSRPIPLPPSLETLQLSACGSLAALGLDGMRVVSSLSVNDMAFPTYLDLSALLELSLCLGGCRRVPASMVLPSLRRYSAEYTDVTMCMQQMPKLWCATLGANFFGDTSWLLKVPHVYYLSPERCG